MTKQDKIIIDESLNGGEQGNLSEEHILTTQEAKTLSRPTRMIEIGGFEELPTSMIALPYVIIVQAGTDVYLADGKTPAPKGTFYQTDLQETVTEIEFVNLRAMMRDKEVERDGVKKIETKLLSLCVNLADFEPFIFSLPVSSFSNWGKMIAQVKKRNVKNSYEFSIKATITSATNKKGQKFYVAQFTLADELDTETLAEMKEKLADYSGVLDRRDLEMEEV